MAVGLEWRKRALTAYCGEIARHLADNSSLMARLPEFLANAYGDAVLLAARESGLAESAFPASSPWTFGEIMDDGFWPGPADEGL
jgi:hypothetical protein